MLSNLFTRIQSPHVARELIRPSIYSFNKCLFGTTSFDGQRLFKKILIANRGEISCRVQRTAKELGIRTVAVFSDVDENAQHVKLADEAYCIGTAAAAESYLLGDKIIEVAKACGAEAVHPGYGFLSENSEFAKACGLANIEFIGPPVEAIKSMGSKSASKDIMISAGVPVTPGYHGDDQSIERLQQESNGMGYPVLIKAVMGGGGKGMRIVETKEDLPEAVEACKREALSSFGDDRVLVEKFLRRPRHVEVQIFADKFGNTVYLFERDCSVQRRHQKVLEEAPAPHISDSLRKSIGESAVAAAKAVGYVGAGTVEFMLDEDDSYYFMEMNTRLQVEHPVTEMITKKDLVELQLRISSGQKLDFQQEDLTIHGHAIEARVYAENPYRDFLPGTGKLLHYKLPSLSEQVRVDTGVTQGDEVSVFYDPMIAKLIVHGPDRNTAIKTLVRSLMEFQVVGVPTNIEFLARTAAHPAFVKGGVNTSFLDEQGSELTNDLGPVSDHGIVLGALSLVIQEEFHRQTQTLDSLEPTSPWGISELKSFRVCDSATRVVSLIVDNSNVKIKILSGDVGNYIVEVKKEDSEPRTYKATGSMNNNNFFINIENHAYTGTSVCHKNSIHIFANDGTLRHECRMDLPEITHTSSTLGSGKNPTIVTPMPGKVIKLMVNEGDSITADQPLMILEAMKMEHVIRAPSDGKVKQIYFLEDDLVDDGKTLIELSKEE